MKILVVTNMYPTDERPNFGSFIKTQVDSLKARGVESDVLFINGNESPLNYLWAIFRLYWRVYTRRYDLVHAHYGLAGLIARFQIRYPLVVSYCGDDLYGSASFSGMPSRSTLFLAWWNKQLARWVDGVIVKSKAMASMLPGVHVEVIPNGVDFDVFRPMDMLQCRKELGLDKNKLYVLYPYKKSCVRKGFRVIEAAVAKFNQTNERRMDILDVYGVSNGKIPLYMNASDVIVLASLWEGSPNAIKEALACNTRIVATPVGDVAELIEGVDGCVLCERDAEDIADKLMQVLALPAKTEARETISRLRIDSIAERVIAVYCRVLATRGAACTADG